MGGLRVFKSIAETLDEYERVTGVSAEESYRSWMVDLVGADSAPAYIFESRPDEEPSVEENVKKGLATREAKRLARMEKARIKSAKESERKEAQRGMDHRNRDRGIDLLAPDVLRLRESQ